MDEFKRLANSRKGYRIHLKKLLSKAADVIERQRNEVTPLDMPSLTDLRDLRDQLRRKDELISALDAEILKHIQEEDDLVTEVCEAEDIKESISTNIAHITQIIDTLHAATVSEPIPISAHPDTSTTRSHGDLTVERTPSTSVEPTPPSSDVTPPVTHTAPPRVVAASHETIHTSFGCLSPPTQKASSLFIALESYYLDQLAHPSCLVPHCTSYYLLMAQM